MLFFYVMMGITVKRSGLEMKSNRTGTTVMFLSSTTYGQIQSVENHQMKHLTASVSVVATISVKQ